MRLPFERYYLPEAQANTLAEVRVQKGHAALVRLVLDGKPVGM